MQLRYDEDFIESAVFMMASRRRSGAPSQQIARFHREREKLYSMLDPEDRNAAFFRLHLGWFREWRMEAPLASVLREFPLMTTSLDVLAFRKALGKNEEGAELYVNETGKRSALVALRMGRLTSDPPLMDYLRHEFTHIHDMLNPGFGYSPLLDLPGLNAAQLHLARERYRLLWDISIDGRLKAAGHLPMATLDQHAAAFARSYSFWPEEKRDRVLQWLWQNPPRHGDLLKLVGDPRGLRHSDQPAPGACCPLCGFSTFDWSDGTHLQAEIASRIHSEFPHWSPEQGLCGRCREIYEAACKFDAAGASQLA